MKVDTLGSKQCRLLLQRQSQCSINPQETLCRTHAVLGETLCTREDVVSWYFSPPVVP